MGAGNGFANGGPCIIKRTQRRNPKEAVYAMNKDEPQTTLK